MMRRLRSPQIRFLVALSTLLLFFCAFNVEAKKFADNAEELSLYNKIKELFEDEKNFETHRMCQQFLRQFENSIRTAEVSFIQAETDEHFFQSIFRLRNVTKNFPGSYWALKSQLAIALKYYALGNYHKSEKELKTFIDTYQDAKDLPKALYFRATSLLQTKDYDRAQKLIDLIKEKYPKSKWASKTDADMANILFYKKKYKEAIQAYIVASRTTKSESKRPFLLSQLGISYMKIGNKKKGLETFQTLLAKYPKSQPAQKIKRMYIVN